MKPERLDAIISRLGEVGDDVPLRLDVAARIAFPDGSIGASSLRCEAARGRLALVRIANKDMTTLGAIKRMVDQCHVKPDLRVLTSVQPHAHGSSSALYAPPDTKQALAAARMRLRKLRESK